MDTGRLRSIWDLIWGTSYIVSIVDKHGAHSYRSVNESLEDAVLLAVITHKSAERLNEAINEQAAEAGELRTLEAVRKAMDRMEID